MNSERQYKLLMNNVTKFTDGLSLAEVKRELIAAGILQTFHQKEVCLHLCFVVSYKKTFTFRYFRQQNFLQIFSWIDSQ